MPHFVLNRNYPLNGFGHAINFAKGQPTWVPPILIPGAVALGAECVDEVVDVLGAEAVEEDVLSSLDRETLLMAAFEQMEKRSGTSEDYRTDYNAQGLPMPKAIEKITGFLPSSKERSEAFQKYRETKAGV